MAKITKKNLVKMSPSEIGKLKAPELRVLLRGARQLFSNQEKTFDKYENSVFSPALDKMRDYYDRVGKRQTSKMNMSDMRNEVFRIQEFFESKTSTVPGARKVALEQDRRIFGVKTDSGISYTEKSGKPISRMTLEQRTNFWASYNEFISMESANYVRNMGSNTIQSYLGEIILESAKRHPDSDFMFTAGDFKELNRRLEKQKAQEEWEMANYEYGDSDVFSGKRPD